MFCSSTSVSLSLYSPLGREYKRANSPLPLGREFDENGVVICREGLRVGTGIADAPWSDRSAGRKLNAELLLRSCLLGTYCSSSLLFEKNDALDAVMGVLGVLLPRFGGGVVLRSSTSVDGTGKDEILVLNGVSNGRRFRGGSLIGWRPFLLVCGNAGLFSTSADPDPTVSPRLCLMVALVLRGDSTLLASIPKASICRISVPVKLSTMDSS